LKILSFGLRGQFASFRDPSVTSNQIVYFIPSKSAVIGLLGAMIGVKRDNSLDQLYGQDYLELFSKVKIGIRFESQQRKITYYTNHRSLKEAKTKPYKKELVENPAYTIFVGTEHQLDKDNESIFEKISESIFENKFVYSPYLGHAYCPATISKPLVHTTEETAPQGEQTSCIILDESETHKDDFTFKISPLKDEASIIIERHLHHFYASDILEKRVLKHWIPVNFSNYRIDRDEKRDLSSFYKVGDEIVCMY
jgi:CRISPR-associated protein Cas5 subtype I-B